MALRRSRGVMAESGFIRSGPGAHYHGAIALSRSSPGGRGRLLLVHFFDAPPGAVGNIGWKCLRVEEPRFFDFPCGRELASFEFPDHIKDYVIAAKLRFVRIDSEQPRYSLERHPRLLFEFARHRIERGLAALKAAAGQDPARRVPGTDEQDTALLVDHQGANPDGHASGQAEPGMHEKTQDRPAKVASGHID